MIWFAAVQQQLDGQPPFHTIAGAWLTEHG
jgi:hypothetical protein